MSPSSGALLCSDLAIFRQGQGNLKWHKMVEVNSAYKHGAYEKDWLESLLVMFNVEGFVFLLFWGREGGGGVATYNGRMDGQRPAERTNITEYTDPHVTHMYLNSNYMGLQTL